VPERHVKGFRKGLELELPQIVFGQNVVQFLLVGKVDEELAQLSPPRKVAVRCRRKEISLNTPGEVILHGEIAGVLLDGEPVRKTASAAGFKRIIRPLRSSMTTAPAT
jgi:hypothetical protein